MANSSHGFHFNGAANYSNWKSANGTDVTAIRDLPAACANGYIPSISYGLHIGSVSPNISGTLYLGGYDSSRCITTSIEPDNHTFSLADIGLLVSSDGSAITGKNGSIVSSVSNLRSTSQTTNSLTVLSNPGLPYLYLLEETCAVIASYLPITFNSTYDLYLWDESSPTFSQLTHSPHSLSFTFCTSTTASTTTDITVPLALFNLTLTSPITSPPFQYFPYRAYTPPTSNTLRNTFHLGRAFLQAAFLAQNWQTDKTWLAQAPGPAPPEGNIEKIAVGDATLAGMPSPPSWADT